jgi:seryl-tRNA synthetase
MLDIKLLSTDTEEVERRLSSRGGTFELETALNLDKKRKTLIAEADELKRRRNEISKNIGKLKRENPAAETGSLEAEAKRFEGRQADLADELKFAETSLEALLLEIPNIPDESVPIGANEMDNSVYRIHDLPPNFPFTPKAHWDLAGNSIDFERGTKVAKTRFTMLVGQAARLERALINFMMDLHSTKGYLEVIPPQLINAISLRGTGQFPKFTEDVFGCEKDDLYLSPTAEVPVTNMYAGEILNYKDLPISFTACSACFRREAGSYGKDVRGLIRQHQFNKVELVKFSTPKESMNALEAMLNDACEVLERLNLHYRVVTLCTGDLGFSAAKTYDIEVWLPGQGVYREISSCSNCKDFQARRANIKYRTLDGKTAFVHTLNGSGLAVGRTMVAVLENYQQEDGSIAVPAALKPYLGLSTLKF